MNVYSSEVPPTQDLSQVFPYKINVKLLFFPEAIWTNYRMILPSHACYTAYISSSYSFLYWLISKFQRIQNWSFLHVSITIFSRSFYFSCFFFTLQYQFKWSNNKQNTSPLTKISAQCISQNHFLSLVSDTFVSHFVVRNPSIKLVPPLWCNIFFHQFKTFKWDNPLYLYLGSTPTKPTLVCVYTLFINFKIYFSC